MTDTGHGMDARVRSHIFEPFFTTKEVGKGTGLGLATVYGIVEQSGGRIEVQSEPDRGSTFTVYLPRDSKPTPASKPHPGAPRSRPGAETVLLVEDEETVRTLTRMVLEKQGYTVVAAGSGAEALRLAEQHSGPIHLLISDVVMPGMSGPQVAEGLALLRPGAAVLYISGYTDEAVTRHGMLARRHAVLAEAVRREGWRRRCARCWTGSGDWMCPRTSGRSMVRTAGKVFGSGGCDDGALPSSTRFFRGYSTYR